MARKQQSTIDVVYVLGTGSAWKNNEIRFSLRSLAANLKKFGKIWVVGECPEFLKNVKHIPFPDTLINNADGNIIRKVLRVCQEEDLSEDFLFINDDHLVMRSTVACMIPPYHKGDLTKFSQEYFEKDFWRGRLYRTRNILVKKGLPALHFDCHTPIVMNKKLFPEVISQFDYEKHIGYTMKSLYGNSVYHQEAVKLIGQKTTLFRPMTTSDIRKETEQRQFVSFNDRGLTAALKQWLVETFPKASPYEEPSSADPFLEIVTWLKSPEKDYTAGVVLFEKYGKSNKVKKYLSKSRTVARDLKLEHKIRELLNYI